MSTIELSFAAVLMLTSCETTTAYLAGKPVRIPATDSKGRTLEQVEQKCRHMKDGDACFSAAGFYNNHYTGRPYGYEDRVGDAHFEEWYLEKACKYSSAEGCAELASHYSVEGASRYSLVSAKDRVPDPIKERDPYMKACRLKDKEACAQWVHLAERTSLVRRDDIPIDVVNLVGVACDLIVGAGCYYLAILYAKRRGVATDLPRAIKLFTSACNLSTAEGCFYLAAAYLAGSVVPKEPPQGRLAPSGGL